jgi:ATP-binding cassette subfamily C protein LapB
VQHIQTVMIVVWGVYLIGDGTLTMGALIGTVILAGRAVGPLAQIVGLAVRFQQAKASLVSLNELMAKPTDRDAKQNYLPRKRFDGAVRTESLSFAYPNQKLVALDRIDLNIQPGERIAILGRIGSGKSTLLRLLNGLYLPSAGSVYADNIDLRQIDPADIHRNIGMVTQECELFYGTLRENVMLAAPHASPEKFLHVARLTGLDILAARHPLGFEMQLGEGGAGLSGGQRQLVSLARCLLAEPSVILMDEPTSAMDGQTEGTFLTRFQHVLGNRTLIVATHRLSLVPLMTRVIVLDNGKVVADGPRDQVMSALSGGQIVVPKQTAVPL